MIYAIPTSLIRRIYAHRIFYHYAPNIRKLSREFVLFRSNSKTRQNDRLYIVYGANTTIEKHET